MDLGVKGRSYVLLGGARGMGYEAGRVLAADGAKLTIISRTQASLDAAGAALKNDFGAEVLTISADAMSTEEMDKALAASVERFGAPRGILVTTGMTFRNGSILEVSDADWEHNFQDVMMGTVRGVRAALPHMLAAGGGNIVVSSAYSARVAKPFLFPYASLKAALVNFTKNLAKTYGGQGIRANCICPGAFATERLNERMDEVMRERKVDRAEAGRYMVQDVFKMPVALNRPGEPHEIGDVMAFALSERGGYMTGAVINVDGGTDF
jgi:NAD(P)-dependent dehydrogenase (short-subunit alcohol dehydrogenase family)